MTTRPARPRTEAELDELLTRPTPLDVEAAAPGDVAVLGCGGKMGPGLVRLIRRALDAAGRRDRVIAVSRFTQPGLARRLAGPGVEVFPCDLLDPDAVRRLPEAPHVILMAGQKFGTSDDPAVTWATNVLVSATVARRFRASRLVAFSTGNVYPLTPVGGGGSVETDPVGPVGEYAQSALARERVLSYCAARHGTPMAFLRLNYAVEPRYGVLRDVAERVREGRPVPLAMGYVNVIWQRDANSVAWRALVHAATPPLVLNVTGPELVSVRHLAEAFGRRFGVTPAFAGTESDTALLSDASRCAALFGTGAVPLDEAIDLVADWMVAGGASLAMPTHFEEREGRF